MAQLLIRQLDDAAVARLKAHARERKMSVEALARDALHRAADELSTDEKLALVARMQAWSRAARVRGMPQTPGADLIREDRDRDR